MGWKAENHKDIFELASISSVQFTVMSFIFCLTSLAYYGFRRIERKSSALPVDDNAFDFGPVRISPGRMLAMIGPHCSDLTQRDLKLIMFMRCNQGFVLNKDLLYDAGWGRDFMPNSRALEQHMLTLRKKLDPDRSNKDMIETVHGQGYRFNG